MPKITESLFINWENTSLPPYGKKAFSVFLLLGRVLPLSLTLAFCYDFFSRFNSHSLQRLSPQRQRQLSIGESSKPLEWSGADQWLPCFLRITPCDKNHPMAMLITRNRLGEEHEVSLLSLKNCLSKGDALSAFCLSSIINRFHY